MTINEKLANTDGILHRLVAQALDMGATGLEIEYKNGQEEVCAMRGNFGIGIASLPSTGADACTLRELLFDLRRRPHTISVSNNRSVRITVRTFDSFGETAFRVLLQASPKD